MAVCPMVPMSNLVESSKKWQGRVVDGRFALRQLLGGSDRSVVFVTERSRGERGAIKLIAAHDRSATTHGEENLLSRWAVTARISHPNLIRLFEFGRCQIEEDRFLYVVMEYAEEDLGQIVPQRRLAPAEVAEMLPPIVEALSFLHGQGFVHGGIKPSNIFAVDNHVKISADKLHHIGEPGERKSDGYSAPEAGAALSAAADVWSVGALLSTVLSQREPDVQERNGSQVLMPDGVPEPYRTIARRCLQVDPAQRCKLSDILRSPNTPENQPKESAAPVRKSRIPALVVVFACIVVLALVIGRMMTHRGAVSSSQPPAQPQLTPVAQPAPASPKNSPGGVQGGSVQHQVLPEIPRQAQKTIHGRVKVSVEVSVDASGVVAEAKLASAGPSRYFANKALAASREWKFTPPEVDGQPSTSTWLLRYEFGRGSTQAFPKRTRP
jgi:TonB family protein